MAFDAIESDDTTPTSSTKPATAQSLTDAYNAYKADFGGQGASQPVVPAKSLADAYDAYMAEFGQRPKQEAPKNSKGIVNDVLVGLGKGTLELPAAATGLADIPAGLMGFDRPFDKATDIIGEKTGFQPKKWAQEAEKDYSPAMQEASKNINAAWQDPNTGALDVAKAYAQNPRGIMKTVVESLPSMFAGNAIGGKLVGLNAKTAKALAVEELAKKAALGGGVGEGTVMAGQAMDNTDKSTDPRTAALTSLVTGVGGGIIGTKSGELASRLGLGDIDQIIASGGRTGLARTGQQGSQTLVEGAKALGKRVAAGAFQEGVVEEGTQSALETAMQNLAEGKPITEGMARNVVEGALAGGVMGAGANVYAPQGEQTPAPSGTGAPPMPASQLPPPEATPTLTEQPPETPANGAAPTAPPPAQPAAQPVASAPVGTAEDVAAKTRAYVDTVLKKFNDNGSDITKMAMTRGLAEAAKANGIDIQGKSAADVFNELHEAAYPPEPITQADLDEKEAERLEATGGVVAKAAAGALRSGASSMAPETKTEESPVSPQGPQASPQGSVGYRNMNLDEFLANHPKPYNVKKGILTTDITKMEDADVLKQFGLNDLKLMADVIGAKTTGSKNGILAGIRNEQAKREKMRNTPLSVLETMKADELKSLVKELGGSAHGNKKNLIDFASTWLQRSLKHSQLKVGEANFVGTLLREVQEGAQDVSDLNVSRYSDRILNTITKESHPDLYQRAIQSQANSLMTPPYNQVPYKIENIRKDAAEAQDPNAKNRLTDLANGLEAAYARYNKQGTQAATGESPAPTPEAKVDKWSPEHLDTLSLDELTQRKNSAVLGGLGEVQKKLLNEAIARKQANLTSGEDNAKTIRSDEGQVPATGAVGEGSEVESSGDLHQPSQGPVESSEVATLGQGATQSEPPEAPVQGVATAPKQTVFEVNGQKVDYNALSDAQKKQWDEADANYQGRLDHAAQMHRIEPDTVQKGKLEKAAGVQLAADRRKITGFLTDKERMKAEADAKKIREGSPVVLEDGRTGVAVSRPSYGKVKIDFGDGKIESIDYKTARVAQNQAEEKPSETLKNKENDEDRKINEENSGIGTGNRPVAGTGVPDAVGAGSNDNIAAQGAGTSIQGSTPVTGPSDGVAGVGTGFTEPGAVHGTEPPAPATQPEAGEIDDQSQNPTSQEVEEAAGQVTPATPVVPIEQGAATQNEILDQTPEAAKQKGDYPKVKVPYQDLEIALENGAGSVRSGKDESGREWSQTMQDNYGEIPFVRDPETGKPIKTEGADKDHIDVFIKPGLTHEDTLKNDKVFIVDQVNPKTGVFDEHKVVMGYPTSAAALKAYNSNYEPGWKGGAAISGMPMAKFKDWLLNGDTKTPVNPKGVEKYQAKHFAAPTPVQEAGAFTSNEQAKEVNTAYTPVMETTPLANGGLRLTTANKDDLRQRLQALGIKYKEGPKGFTVGKGDAARVEDIPVAEKRYPSGAVVQKFGNGSYALQTEKVSTTPFKTEQGALDSYRNDYGDEEFQRAFGEANKKPSGIAAAEAPTSAEGRVEGSVPKPVKTRKEGSGKRGKVVDSDNLLQAIFKLGGLSKVEASQRGMDESGFSLFGRRLFNDGSNAKTYDEMAELLRGYGFDAPDPHALERMVSESVHQGVEHYTPRGHELKAELMAKERFNDEQARAALALEGKLQSGEITLDDLSDEKMDDIFANAPELPPDFFETFGDAYEDEDYAGQGPNETDSGLPTEEILSPYTDADLAERERATAESAERERAEVEKAEAKRKADLEIDTLADEMLGNIGTQDIFSPPADIATIAAQQDSIDPAISTPAHEIDSKDLSDVEKQAKVAMFNDTVQKAYMEGDLGIPEYMIAQDLLLAKDYDGIDRFLRTVIPGYKEDSSLGSAQVIKAKGQVNMRRLLSMIGSNMYKANLAETSIKEMVQNSFDAVKAAIVKDKSLKGKGRIDVVIDPYSRHIAIRDNGRGMDPKTIQGAFLTIAGSDKSDLGGGAASGGFGMAKAAFIYGNEKIYVRTVRNGVKATMATSGEDLLDNKGRAEIVTSDTMEPNGTLIIVKVPQTVEIEGQERTVWMPTRPDDVDFFKQPLLNPDVEFTFQRADIDPDQLVDSYYELDQVWNPLYRNERAQLIPVGKHMDMSGYVKNTSASFGWGSADIYIGKKREEKSWNLKHQVLSAGVFQFNDMVPLRGFDPVPYNIIIDVKPTVKADSPSYPFNLRREGWQDIVESDVEALKKYIAQVAAGQEAQETVDVFKNIKALPKVDTGAIYNDENLKYEDFIPKKPVEKTNSEDLKAYIPPKITVEGGKVTGTDKAGETVTYVDLEAEKTREKGNGSTFNANKEAPKAADYLLDMGIDTALPVYHNNTSVDYAEENPQAAVFFAEVGSLLFELRDKVASLGSNTYKGLNDKNTFFGVSIDKSYHGVHITVPFHGIFLNPLEVKGDSLPGIAYGLYDTMVHEFTHIGVKSHDENFTVAYHDLAAKLAADGFDLKMRTLMMRVMKKHRDTFLALRGIYEQSTTKNIARSLHKGEGDTGTAQSTGRAEDAAARSAETATNQRSANAAPTTANAEVAQELPGNAGTGTQRGGRNGLSTESAELTALFNRLDARASKATRAEAQKAVDAHPLAERIRFVEDNFYDLLFDLDQSGKVKIKC